MRRLCDHVDLARQGDPYEIADHLREADLRELRAEGFPGRPLDALLQSCSFSNEVYAALDARSKERTPIALFGISRCGAGTLGYNSVWLLGTDGLYAPHNIKPFLRYSRLWMNYFIKCYGSLGNEVHAANDASLRWLKWLGFQSVSSSRNLFTGELFHTMVLMQ